MQIPEEIRKCVAFLARSNEIGGYDEKATVFFVAYPISDTAGLALYAVTARHVIVEIGKHRDNTPYCRVNTRCHGLRYVPLPRSTWVFNDDDRIDVAVAPVPFDPTEWDHKCLALSMFIDPTTTELPGPGEDLVFPGLFSERAGKNRNIPIIRVGNIAAMPEEPIATKDCGVLLRAYLVEARSIGGLSGSPVFWYRDMTRVSSHGMMQMVSPAFFLLGLVHGHYRCFEWPETCDASNKVTRDGFELNMGIAIVIPAADILATLNHPALQQRRDTIRQDILFGQSPGLTSPDALPESPAHTITQEDTSSHTETITGLFDSFTVDASEEPGEDSGPSTSP